MYQNNFNNFGYPPYNQMNYTRPAKCYPVSSFDEVKSAMISFDGSISVFTDFANGVIYTKGINADGTAFINTYTLTQNPVGSDPIEERLIQLEHEIDEIKRGLTNEIYTGTDATGTEPDYGVNAESTGNTKSNGGSSSNKRK